MTEQGTNSKDGGGVTTINRTGQASADDLLDKVAELYAHERTQDLDRWAALWAEDAAVRFPLGAPGSVDGPVGKTAIVGSTAQKFEDRRATDIDAALESISGGTRVLARLDVFLHMADGQGFGGPILVIYTFDTFGNIVLMEEYVSSSAFRPDYILPSSDAAAPAGS